MPNSCDARSPWERAPFCIYKFNNAYCPSLRPTSTLTFHVFIRHWLESVQSLWSVLLCSQMNRVFCVTLLGTVINLLKPNDIYICRTAALTSRRYILNFYSTNIHIEYFKHAA